jgi:hypothetical protein
MNEQLNKYIFQPKKLEDIITTAKIVVDTNVLLAGYQYRDLTFKEIINTLSKLNEQARLLIPSHVLKEFFKRRPEKIVEMIQSVQQHRDKIPSYKTDDPIEKVIPSLELTSLHSDISEIEETIRNKSKELNENIKKYRDLHNILIEEFKGYFNVDPILEIYSQLFKSAFFKPEGLQSEEDLIKHFNDVRVKEKLPPGYKDAKKNNGNEAGDFIIWSHILEIKDDVIFITADNKPDWVYSEPGNGKVINARRELVEEFYSESDRKTFTVVNPATFLKIFNPDVEPTVIEDLSHPVNKTIDRAIETNFIHDAILNLNDEGNSLVANTEYGKLMRRLINNTVESTRPKKRYLKGTSPYLDKVLSEIVYNLPFFDEVSARAHKIADNDDLSDKDKDLAYHSLAEWALINQDA